MTNIPRLNWRDTLNQNNRVAEVDLNTDFGSFWNIALNGTDINGQTVIPRFMTVDNINSIAPVQVTMNGITSIISPYTRTTYTIGLFQGFVTANIIENVKFYFAENSLGIPDEQNQLASGNAFGMGIYYNRDGSEAMLSNVNMGGFGFVNAKVKGLNANAILFQASITAPSERNGQEKFNEIVSVKDFGAVGDGVTDDSAAFNAAIAYFDGLAGNRGGTIYVPPGIYLAKIDASKAAADFEHWINIRGAGKGAVQIRPTATGDIIINMVGRNQMMISDLTVYAGDTYQAYAGIVMARRVSSPNCNKNALVNVDIIGNYSGALMFSVAAESCWFENCKFTVSSGGSNIALICGNDPAAPNVNLVVPGIGDLQANANTNNYYVNCEFTSNQPGDICVLSKGGAHTFDGCTFLGYALDHLIKFCDPDGGIIGGNYTFSNCHYEGLTATGSIFWIDVTAGTYLYGLVDVNSRIVITAGATYLDYDRADNSKLLILDGCNLAPAKSLDVAQVGINCHCDIATNCRFDFIGMRSSSVINVFLLAEYCDIKGNRINAYRAEYSTIQVPDGFTAAPTYGCYAKGTFIKNVGDLAAATPMASGNPMGWILKIGGSVETGPGGTTVNTVNGSNKVTTAAPGYPFYEGARVYINTLGYTMIRKIIGQDYYLLTTMGVTGNTPINFSGDVAGKFLTAPNIP